VPEPLPDDKIQTVLSSEDIYLNNKKRSKSIFLSNSDGEEERWDMENVCKLQTTKQVHSEG
ncbi:hypothetical protein Tco_0584581, partial [Tanacetum coccineum]